MMEKNLVAMVTEWAMDEMVMEGSVTGVRVARTIGVVGSDSVRLTARVVVEEDGWFTGGDLDFSVVDGVLTLVSDPGIEADLMTDDESDAREYLGA